MKSNFYLFSLLFIFSINIYAKSLIQRIDKNIDTITLLEKAKTLIHSKEYKKAITLCDSTILTLKDNRSKVAFLRISGTSYKRLNDYHNSIIILERVIKSHSIYEDKKIIIDDYIDLAWLYKKINTQKSIEKSIFYILKADSTSKTISINPKKQFTINNNLANYYKKLKDKKNALKHYNLALNISKKNKLVEQNQMVLFNLASFYSNGINSTKFDIIKAEGYYNEALKLPSKKHNASIYKNLGIIRYLEEKPEVALNYYNKAINTLLNTNITTPKELPSTSLIKESNREIVLSILYEKYYSWIKLYNITNKKDCLDYALETLNLADFILDDIFKNILNQKSQLFWRNQAASFYFLGVHTSYLKNDINKAFYFSEKSKSLLLLNNTASIKIKERSNIPLEFFNRERKLKSNIYQLQREKRLNNNDSIDNLLYENKISLNKLTDSLFKKFPDYKKLSTKSKQLPYDDFIKEIKDNELYLSFVWDKAENQYNTLYCLFLSKDYKQIIQIKDLEAFKETVYEFNSSIKKPFKTNKDLQIFQNASYNLYHFLFPTEETQQILKEHKTLIIIPDNEIQNIAFDAIISTKNTNNYLINSHEISYAYSISHLLENKTLKRKASKNFIGFAPSEFNYDHLQALPKSKIEIKNINNIVNGDSYLDQLATKENFLKNIKDYKIIHLSTHANSNDSISPWIAFKNKKIYLHELYNSKTNADLVVLSACKTSLGKINKGEGVFSLARGFFYTGANSVISSLWNVNDKSNAEITTSFYSYLKEGKTKSASLRHAKLDYLSTHNLSETSPYYWSSLVLIGDDNGISITNDYWLYLLIPCTLLLILFFFFNKRKNLG